MIDILTPAAQASLRDFLLDIGIEATTRAMHAQLVDPIRVTSDVQPEAAPISVTPEVASDAVTAPAATEVPATPPTVESTAPAAVANIPAALVPADHAYFERSLWCDMRVRSTLADANQVVDEFNVRFPK